jgi:hypothetical protein
MENEEKYLEVAKSWDGKAEPPVVAMIWSVLEIARDLEDEPEFTMLDVTYSISQKPWSTPWMVLISGLICHDPEMVCRSNIPRVKTVMREAEEELEG